MRCVSKRWSLMGQDPVFLDACARVSVREPSLLLKGTEGPYWAYEPGLNAWKYMPPTFLHPQNSQGTCSLVTVSGGRILFIMRSPLYSLMIFNPLNNSKRLLPPMFDMSQSYDLPTASEMHVVGMFFDCAHEYYNIVVADKRTNATVEDHSDSDDEFMLEPISSQVYDSRTCTWDLMESFEPEYELFILNAAVFNYSLRLLTVAPKVSELFWSRPVVEELAIYKLISDSWAYDAPQIPTQNQSLVAPHLFSCKGTLMLIAAVRCKAKCEENWTGIIIWKLEMVGNVEDRWIKLVEIDLEGENDMLVDVTVDTFFFLSEGDLVYFGSDTGSTLGVINVLRHCWSFLPPFPGFGYDRPLPAGTVPEVRFQTFLYEPRFDVVV